MAYLLDANVFISAKNLHYGLDFCPAFWDWLIREHERGTVYSVEKVGDELTAGTDELGEWANERGDEFLLAPGSDVLPALGTVARWVNEHERYTPAAKTTFLEVGDFYLVSQALAGDHVVVTHERPADSIHRVKIPSVCIGVGARRCMTPYEMLRRERARFVLGGAAG